MATASYTTLGDITTAAIAYTLNRAKCACAFPRLRAVCMQVKLWRLP